MLGTVLFYGFEKLRKNDAQALFVRKLGGGLNATASQVFYRVFGFFYHSPASGGSSRVNTDDKHARHFLC
jgi:hypothetical protein